MRIVGLFVISLCLLGPTSLAQGSKSTVRETFTDAGSAEFADRWETVGGNWQAHGNRLEASSPSSRSFAYLPDTPEATELQVSARLQVTDRDSLDGWALAGVTIYLGPTEFWQLALVEGPDRKTYVELVEMFAGTWQAQREGEHPLQELERAGQWAGWEYSHDYKLSLTLTAETVTGTVTDPATRETITQIRYAWGQARGTKSGRPGLLVSGFRMAVGEFTAEWVPPTSLASGLTVQRGKRGSVAVLDSLPADSPATMLPRLTSALQEGGYGVTRLSCSQLVTPGTLDSRSFDVLILPASRRFPAVAMDPLLRFLRGGGDLVLMGGLPFTEPLYQVGEEWITGEEAADRLAATPIRNLLFDFETGGGTEWQRSTNHPESASKASTVPGPEGKALFLDIRGLEGWDTFSVDLLAGLPAGHNVVCFSARASENTPAMVVEIRENDGSRWIATVALTPEWRKYVVPVTEFKFWGDVSLARRGGPGDSACLAKANYLSFGLAGSHIPGIQGDHQLWIDQVGTSQTQIPPPVGENDLFLNAFSDYDVYRLENIAQIAPAESAIRERMDLTWNGTCSGWSAVGFAFPNESVFVPLLEARDSHGRTRGWAAGALLNHRGTYRNSVWLLFGVETPDFYQTQGFLDALPGMLTRMASPDRLTELRRSERLGRVAPYPLTTAPPHDGFIRRTDDDRHLIYPDGRRFFMIGCNYVGGFSRCSGRMWTDALFDAREVEDDFRKAHEAGLNVMRYWIQGPLDQDIRTGQLAKVQTIRECARRYGVYLLLDLPGTGYSTEEAMLESHRAIAEAFRDEPMVLGYDLRNEPYVTTLGGIIYSGDKPPVQTVDLSRAFPGRIDMAKVDAWIEERPWWLHLPGIIKGDEARRVTVANLLWNEYLGEFNLRSSSMPGMGADVPVGPWGEVIDVVNRSLERWLEHQLTTIRRADPNHLITVGHNTSLCILPANRQLDFVSKHIYTRPYSRDHVLENITTLDRLKALWPDQPITLGEFGYSNGISLKNGYLDPHTSSVGEMIHFLYAFANDYDGCKKWMLVDWPLAVMRHYGDWNRGLKTRIYEERFGLYSYDGTRGGRPKPIAHALRFFRDFADHTAPGGELEVTDDANPIGTGYVFRTDKVLFVGGRKAELPQLRFTCPETTNVMLVWETARLRLMSTADVIVEIDLKNLAPDLARPALRSSASYESRATQKEDGCWTVSLLAGETVVFEQ